MRALRILRLIPLVVLASVRPVSAEELFPEWNRAFGNADEQHIYAIVVDNVGNTIITGGFQGSVSFGGVVLTSVDEDDVFMAKYASDGTHLWSRRFGGSGIDVGLCLAVDDAGSIYLAGRFHSAINLGGSTLSSAGGYDIFLAKFYSNGNHVWSAGYGATDTQAPGAIASDGTNKLYMVGSFRNSLDLGQGAMASAGGYDVFWAQFDDGSGYCQRSLRFGDAGEQYGWGVTANNVGEIVFTGSMQGTVDFGGGALTSAGGMDVFLAKYNTYGQHLWSNRFGDSNDQHGRDVEFIGNSRSWVATGIFLSTINLGGGALISGGSYDTFLARFDHNSVHAWSRQLTGPEQVSVEALDVADAGMLGVTGYFYGSADCGGAPLVSAGDRDVFMALYNANGTHYASQSFGENTDQHGQDIECVNYDDVRLAGDFHGTIDFGLGPLTSAGETDIFLASFAEGISAVIGDALREPLALRVHPHPARVATQLRYTLAQAGWVRLTLHDAAGRCLAHLVDQFGSAGEHSCPLPRGIGASGLRFARLSAGGRTITRPIITLE